MALRTWKIATVVLGVASAGLAILCGRLLFPFGDPTESLLILRSERPQELAAALDPRCAAGTLCLIAGTAASLPDGWVPCEGQTLRRADYPELFAAMDDDPSKPMSADPDVVTLPDFRGMALFSSLLTPELPSFVPRGGQLIHGNLFATDNGRIPLFFPLVTPVQWVIRVR